MNQRGVDFPLSVYSQIKETAEIKNVVDNNEIMCETESEAIQQILDGLKKEVHSGRKSEKRS